MQQLVLGWLFSILIVGFMALTVKACDSEHDYQHAKYSQWAKDRDQGKPFTNFNGE